MRKIDLPAWYKAGRELRIALAGMFARQGGIPAVLLEGPPGAGKSAAAEAVAEALGGPFFVYQFHAWADSDELFQGVDVQAAVAGDAAHVRQPGILARVAAASQESDTPVVLLLDEIDKAPERAEYLLLDWLQSGRVPVQPGVMMETRMDRVLVFITSNAIRELSDATLRRVRRVWLNPPPTETVVEILARRTTLSKTLVRLFWTCATFVARSEDNNALSIQEGVNGLSELMAAAESARDVRLVLAGWAARTEDGRRTALTAQNSKKFPLDTLWGEVVKERRAE